MNERVPAATCGIGVVVVNWNGQADTLRCLHSLAAAAPGPARVVVVDNASSDGSREAIERWRAARDRPPPVALLSLPANRGYAGACNVGVAHLVADPSITHVLLLNNDATVDPEFFAHVSRALGAAPDAALLGPTIYAAGRPGEVWYAGGHFVEARALVVHGHAVPQDPRPLPTAFVTGCALLLSRHAWDILGPLPECYFMYLEDAEYSYRARAAGLAVVYAPRAVAYHGVGATVQRTLPGPWVEYLKTRNRAWFARRNFQGWERWVALAYFAISKPVRGLVELVRGRPALAWAIVRGAAEGLLSKQGQRQVGESAAVKNPLDGVLVHE
ncbi:MAG TPA: glycosyltransferase family 2 protein [Gemmatimonadales bacterium]|nr:glycosyltransferase family 2 protein [Gemmatimonadales bacterium]